MTSWPWFPPMAPALAKPFHRPGWVYEEKVDGWRIVAVKEGRRVQLVSRTGKDHAERFPDIARAVAELQPQTAILDGEVAVFDEQLVSRFHFLTDVPPDGQAVTPPTFIAFDLIRIGARDLRARPLTDRRRALEDLIDDSPILPARRLPADGMQAWAVVQACGYEGLVAKDPQAPYRPGPTSSWRKVKVRYEGRFLIGGIAPTVSGYVGLLVGARVGRELRYVGGVEWGVRRGIVDGLMQGARLREDSPFVDLRRWSDVTWLEPRLLAEVAYSEIIGGRLRASVYPGLVAQNVTTKGSTAAVSE